MTTFYCLSDNKAAFALVTSIEIGLWSNEGTNT